MKTVEATGRNVLFIDANQYVYLYGMVAGKKLLDSIEEQAQSIFVTDTVVNEVTRNKLDTAIRLFDEQLKKMTVPDVHVSDHLFGLSDSEVTETRSRVQKVREDFGAIKEEMVKRATETIGKIVASQDEVSRRLQSLFQNGVVADAETIQRGRVRKEFGNPPGKPNDPLGDQVSWEQLLTHCEGARNVWIVTSDSDYFCKFDKRCYLNPFLHRDLTKVISQGGSINIFDSLTDGLTDFGKRGATKAEKLPTKEEAKEIKKEENWLDRISQMNDEEKKVWNARVRKLLRKGFSGAFSNAIQAFHGAV